jgi:excisionase family DNA binding protein
MPDMRETARPVDDLLTTKQLQNLLHVDRITIYRMLHDGRLRGFKVGGQWRFSRREIESWLQQQQNRLERDTSPQPPGEFTALLSQALPLSCVQAIQGIGAEALDIAMVSTGLDGTPLTGVGNSCGFCHVILSMERGRLRCAESWRQQPDGQVHPCHAGVLCASVPIAVAGQPVAIAAACQFTTPGPNGAEPAWQSRLPELAASLGLAEADLRAVAGTVRVIPENDLLRVSRLLRRVADTLSEIGQERVNLLGRLEKIAEMSRI